ncbi:MAG: WD40 repeat domain-containing protein [Flavobacteriales bacterium]|nr:WD40 repeat domain-containing protein [Flavobacteriales bacterium]
MSTSTTFGLGKMVRFISTLLFVSCFGCCLAQNLKMKHIRTFNGHSHGVRHVVFAPDGNTFASGGTRGEVFIWDVDGEAALKKLEGHYGSISDVRYAENGKYLISAGEDGQIKVWDAVSGFCMQRIISPTGEKTPINKINFALMSSQSETVYFGGTNHYVCSIPFKGEGEPEVIYVDQNESIRCAILSPNGKELIFAAGKYLMALDLASKEVVREYNTGNCVVNSLEFSDDGKRLLTWCENSRVDMRDPSTFYLLTSFRSGTGGNKFSNLAFTEDQKYVITGDHASRFNVWDLNNKQQVLDQGAEQGTIMTFDLESGPNYLLSGSLDKSIKLWKIVEDIPEETKGRKKKKPTAVEKVVEPEVEIIQYEQPVEDVPQKKGPVNTNVVLKTPEKIETYERPVPKDPVSSILPERKNNRRIKPIRKEHKLVMKSHNLKFEIWDAQVIDGDIVSIYIDNTCIVDEYSITASKRTVRFNATGYKRVYLYLHAHNLGTIPPNTVTMTISDGTQILDIQLRSDMTGSAAIELIFDDE